MSKVNFFKPENTVSVGGTTGMYIYIDDANAKLERECLHYEGCTRGKELVFAPRGFFPEEDVTHRSIVIVTQELPKKECEHKGQPSLCDIGSWVCKYCGIGLKAKWEVAE